MGADSSTLSSINSLSQTLVDIEKRLTDIEDLQFTHERTIAIDNTVLVSGKRIVCRPEVGILAGPVIGKVSHDSVRVMVEVDTATEATFNVFLADEVNSQCRYLFEKRLSLQPRCPGAISLHGLRPNTHYHIYIGGVGYNDTVMNYCTFRTLPAEPSIPIRFLSISDSKIDQVGPGNADLLSEMQVRVCELSHNGKIQAGNIDHSHVHGVFHVGNTVSIDLNIRAAAAALAQGLCDEQCIDDSWKAAIDKIEADMTESYRKALCHPKLKRILRSCGNIFLSGTLEAVMETISFLTVVAAEEENEDHKVDDGSLAESSLVSSNLKEGSVSDANSLTADSKEVEEDEGMAMLARSKALREEKRRQEMDEKTRQAELAANGGRRILKKRGEEIGEESDHFSDSDKEGSSVMKDDELVAPDRAVRSIVKRSRKKVLKALDGKLAFARDMERAAAALIARAARRAYWKYYRILWDDDCDSIIQLDLQREHLLRRILASRREVEVKRRFLNALNTTRLRLLREFGEEYNAAEKVTARYNDVKTELQALENALMVVVNESVLLQSYQGKEVSEGGCIRAGRSLIVVLDTAFSTIGSSGDILYLQGRETLLRDALTQQVENLLSTSPPEIVYQDVYSNPIPMPPENVDPDNDAVPNVNEATEKALPIDSVVLLSSGPVARCSAAEISVADQIPAAAPVSVRLSAIDAKRLFRLMFRWKQANAERSALIIAPAFNISKNAIGFISPFVDDDDGTTWNVLQCRITTLFCAQRSADTAVSRGRRFIDNKESSHDNNNGKIDMAFAYNMDGTPVVNEVPNLSIATNPTTITSKPVFYDFELCPARAHRVPESIPVTRSAPLVAMGADVAVSAVLASSAVPIISIGPVVGRVNATSATILLEIANSAFVKMMVVDQLTGYEFQNTLLLHANMPASFHFDALLPDRAYDIFVHGCRSHEPRATVREFKNNNKNLDENRIADMLKEFSFVLGTFTTPKVSIYEDSAREMEVIQQLRSSAHGIEAVAEISNQDNSLPIDVEAAQSASLALNTNPSVAENDTPENKRIDSFRVVVVGNNQPNSSVLTRPFEFNGSADAENRLQALSADKSNLLDGIRFCEEVGGVLSESWNGVDLVVHVGRNVDLTFSLHGVVANLALAEQAAAREFPPIAPGSFHLAGSSYSSPNNLQVLEGEYPVSPLMRKYLDIAEQELRTAYRLHWGATKCRNLLSGSSHLVVSSILLDILDAFHVSSWRMLNRELSPFASKWLYVLLSKLQQEYECALWTPDFKTSPQRIMQPQSPLSRTHFYRQGEIGIFQVQLNFLFSQDNFGTRADGLISEDQFQELSKLLQTANNVVDSKPKADSYINDVERAMGTLILVLPVPLLSDFGVMEESALDYGCGLRYTSSELLRLLDLLVDWLAEFEGREVVLITGGASTGFLSTIHCEILDENTANEETPSGEPNPESNENDGEGDIDQVPAPVEKSGRSIRISQICVGGFVSHLGDGALPLSDELYSTKCRYLFEYSDLKREGQVGVVEVDNKQLETWDLASLRLLGRSEFAKESSSWNKQLVDSCNGNSQSSSVAPGVLLTSDSSQMAPHLWRITKSHIQYFYANTSIISQQLASPASPSPLHPRMDARAFQIMMGINKVFNRDDNVWKSLHAVLKKTRYFDIPFNQGSALIHNIINLFAFVFSQVQENELFHIPSTFIAKKVWDKFVDSYLELEAGISLPPSTKAVNTAAARAAGTDSVIANIYVDCEYFKLFMKQVLEVQVLMEYFASVFGMLDDNQP